MTLSRLKAFIVLDNENNFLIFRNDVEESDDKGSSDERQSYLNLTGSDADVINTPEIMYVHTNKRIEGSTVYEEYACPYCLSNFALYDEYFKTRQVTLEQKAELNKMVNQQKVHVSIEEDVNGLIDRVFCSKPNDIPLKIWQYRQEETRPAIKYMLTLFSNKCEAPFLMGDLERSYWAMLRISLKKVV
ncbi:hypothetical protein K501DRAFT_267912 [Backusella circina FSU 941]|nr:hypothetical protein K501DRAFT_267912 [Backusella circina FSU 941]